MEGFTIEEAPHTKGAKIKIIGCGGGGGNTINYMIKEGLSELDLIAANTDGQALNNSLAKTKIQLGEKTTGGLGAGGKPEIGAESARESYEELKAALEQSDMVFIASGLGGGTGTGATPIVAKAAKEVGSLAVSVVTMPFNFEGKAKRRLAEQGLAELKKESDSILVIQNEKLLSLVDKNASTKAAFALVDDVLARAVRGMVSILVENSRINVDFADIKAIMSHRGLALMGMGEAQGQDAAMEALQNALESPLLDGLDIKRAKGVIVHYKHHSNFPFLQIAEVSNYLQEMLDENITFKFGESEDDAMEEDKIEITVIATGFDYHEQGAKVEGSDDKFGSNAFIKNFVKTGTYDSEDFLNIIEEPSYTRNQMD